MQIYTYRSAHSRSAKNFKRFFSVALSLLVLLQATPGAFAVNYVSANHGGPYGDNPVDKITLCHDESGDGTEYHSSGGINVSAVINENNPESGHDGHPTDIIPPFHYQKNKNSPIESYPGKNWNADNEQIWNGGECDGTIVTPIPGCTNPDANNYDPDATEDDGSCTFDPIPGCMNPDATNYNPDATQDDGSCTFPPVLGCTNPQANNYDPHATQDDGSCTFDTPTGTITVHKIVINDDGGTAATSSFSFQINGSSTTAFESDGANDLTLPVGTYSITEVTASGYTPSYSASCTNFQIVANKQSATCVVTNNDDPRQPDPSADLGIDKSINDQTPDEGQTVVYTLVVTNSGPDNATGVVVNDVLPAGLTYVSASSTVGSYNSGTGAWTIGNLNDGDSATLEITATVNSGTAGNHIINTGSVDGDQADSNSANDTDSSESVVNTPDTPNDVCPNIDGVQTEVPSDKELKNGECVTPDNNSGGGSHHRGGGGLIVVNNQPEGQVLGATFDPGLPNTGISPLSNSDTARNMMILFLSLATLIGLNLVSFNFVREE